MSDKLAYMLAPLRYVFLFDENGEPLWKHDLLPTASLAVTIVVPFAIFRGNFLAPDGFLDRLGDFLSVLTGFYVAALIAVATFASHTGLDKPMEVGKVLMRDGTTLVALTRREYTTAMFGFLSFLSLLLTLVGIFLVPIASQIRLWTDVVAPWGDMVVGDAIGLVVKIAIAVLVGHLLVTTSRGLYYMIDRLYAKAPKVNPKPTAPRIRRTDE